MPNTSSTTSPIAPSTAGAKPSRAQLNYLRALASQTASSFTYPATKAEASAQINRLKKLAARTDPELAGDDARRERLAISAELHQPSDSATAIHDSEITGWGSNARWA
jgi:hypothetical protein